MIGKKQFLLNSKCFLLLLSRLPEDDMLGTTLFSPALPSAFSCVSRGDPPLLSEHSCFK